MEKYSNIPVSKIASEDEYFEFETEAKAWKFLDLLTKNGYDDYSGVKPRQVSTSSWIIDMILAYAHNYDEMLGLTEQV